MIDLQKPANPYSVKWEVKIRSVLYYSSLFFVARAWQAGQARSLKKHLKGVRTEKHGQTRAPA